MSTPLHLSTNLAGNPPPGDGNDPHKATTDKVNGYVIFGQILIIGMALSVTGILGVAFYGLVLKVSVTKPISALIVIAVVSGFFGEIFIAHGNSWAHNDLSDYGRYLESVNQGIQAYINPPPIQNQKPGLSNQGNTCFINGSLQALFSLPPYRAALLETAEKEHGYYTAWIKLYQAIIAEQDAGFTEWNDAEMRGALICLARSPDVTLGVEEITQLEHTMVKKLEQQKSTETAAEHKEQPQEATPNNDQENIQNISAGSIKTENDKDPPVAGTDAVEQKLETAVQNKVQERIRNNKLCFTSCLTKSGLLETPFSRTLEGFKIAYQKDEKWPDVSSDLSASFIQAICAFKEDPMSRKYFDKLLAYHETYQETFAMLQRTIGDYTEREKLLLGDVTKLTREQVATPSDIRLNYLRNFLRLDSHTSSRQEDAEEFITQLLRHIRSCDYPGLFAFLKVKNHLRKFETTNLEIQQQVYEEWSKKERDEKVPQNLTACPHNLEQLILFPTPFPTSENKTGQEVLNEWMTFTEPEESEEKKSKNLSHYVEGSYYTFQVERVLENFPDYLIVALKRFTGGRERRDKISTPLDFTNTLMIQGQKYRVVAITTHHGNSLEHGHYTALVHSSNQWWQCNDSSVSKATTQDLSTGFSQGYIYCLEKVID